MNTKTWMALLVGLFGTLTVRGELLYDRGLQLISPGHVNNWNQYPKNIGWAFVYSNDVWYIGADTFTITPEPGVTHYRIERIDLWVGSYRTLEELNHGADLRLIGGTTGGANLTRLKTGAYLFNDSYANYHPQDTILDRPENYVRAAFSNEPNPPRIMRVTFTGLNWYVPADTELIIGLDNRQTNRAQVFQMGMGFFTNDIAAIPYGGDGRFFRMSDSELDGTLSYEQIDYLGIWNGTDFNMAVYGVPVPAPDGGDVLYDRGLGVVAATNINNWNGYPKNIGWAWVYDADNAIWYMGADTFTLAPRTGIDQYQIDRIDFWVGSYPTTEELENGANMRLIGGTTDGSPLQRLKNGAQLHLDSYANYHPLDARIDRPERYVRSSDTNEATPPRIMRVTFTGLNWRVSAGAELIVGLDTRQTTRSRVFQKGMGPFASEAAAAPHGGDGKFFYIGDTEADGTLFYDQVESLGVWNGTDFNMVVYGFALPTLYAAEGSTADTVVLDWWAIANRPHTLYTATNLLEGFSSMATQIPTGIGFNSYTDSVPAVIQQYWRISTE